MKKVCTMLLILLCLFTACGEEETAAGQQDPALEPSAVKEPEKQEPPATTEEPETPEEQDVSGIYYIDNFADHGAAAAKVREISNDVLSVELFVYQYDGYENIPHRGTLWLHHFTMTAGKSDEGYSFTAHSTNENTVLSLDGQLYIENGEMRITYQDAAFTEDYMRGWDGEKLTSYHGAEILLPTYLVKAEDEIYYALPLYDIEIMLQFPNDIDPDAADAMFGEPISGSMIEAEPDEDRTAYVFREYENCSLTLAYYEYMEERGDIYIDHFTTTDADFAPVARDIKIGDSFEKVFNSFLHEGSYEEIISAEPDTYDGHDIFTLYGSREKGSDYGSLSLFNENPAVLGYAQCGKLIEFFFDEDGSVFKISYKWVY